MSVRRSGMISRNEQWSGLLVTLPLCEQKGGCAGYGYGAVLAHFQDSFVWANEEFIGVAGRVAA
jgi:hypothetical protein